MKKVRKLKKAAAMLLAAFGCAGSLALGTPMAQAAQSAVSPILAVDGTGLAEALPDCASISLGVSTRAADAAAAQAANAKLASNVRTALVALGIESNGIQTRDFHCYPEYTNDGKNGRRLIGYMVSNTVTVTVKDFALISQVIDQSLANGATEVYGLSFSLRDAKAVRARAIKMAIADAHEKAEIIAAALGKKIIGIQAVSDGSGHPPMKVYRNVSLAKGGAEDAAATPIEAGTISYEAAVHIEFIMQ